MRNKAVETLNREWMDQARKLGLLDQKHFKQALDEYNHHVKILEGMHKSIKQNGVTITVPVGRDGEKTITNPVINDLLRVEKSAQSLRKELDDKMDKALIIYQKEKEDEEIL